MQDAPRETKLREVLQKLDLDQKLALTSGADHWRTRAIPEHGIAALKLSDGPTGVRGSGESGRTSSACFPCGVCLAASWNREVLEQVGEALADEAKSKGAHVVLGPTINLQRLPLAGRNFECYSEDPYLTGELAVAWIQGLQAHGVGACAKHFVANDCEFERRSISSEVAERPLRELYLRAFEHVIARAEPWLVMSAYNRINGTYASCHPELLDRILKREWGYGGVVVSDWGAATESAADALAGLDLEMPGPGRSLGPALRPSVEQGIVSERRVDEQATRVLRLLARAGRLAGAQHSGLETGTPTTASDEEGTPTPGETPAETPSELSRNRPEHRALARRAAGEGIVLLQNRGLLPLSAERPLRIAVIGPLAERPPVQGGGSAFVHPHYQVSMLQALEARSNGTLEVSFSAGCSIPKFAPLIPEAATATRAGSSGFDVSYWNDDDFEGPPQLQGHTQRSQAFFGRAAPEGIDAESYAVRYETTFTPERSGVHVFGTCATGRSRLWLDDALCVDNWTAPEFVHDIFGAGQTTERTGASSLQAGRSYSLRVDYLRPASSSVATLRFGVHRPVEGDPIEEATRAARAADVALIVVGTGREWETEGRDRDTLALPGDQDTLVERVLESQPRSIVILHTGGPVSMPWIERAPAVMLAWFGGQELGNALCDVLFGDVDPSGRLPMTFPRQLEDSPTHTCYPGARGKLGYDEGLLMGYRWYDARQIEPLFPFGHGIGYSRFEYRELRCEALDPASARYALRCEIKNVGERAGFEVVQLYVHRADHSPLEAEQTLRQFEKVWLEPARSAIVSFELDASDFAHWDLAERAWCVPAERFEVRVGSSSRRIRARASIAIEAPLRLSGGTSPTPRETTGATTQEHRTGVV